MQQSLIKNRFYAFTKMHLLVLWTHFINITMNGNDLHMRLSQAKKKQLDCPYLFSNMCRLNCYCWCIWSASSPIFKSIELICLIVSQTVNKRQQFAAEKRGRVCILEKKSVCLSLHEPGHWIEVGRIRSKSVVSQIHIASQMQFGISIPYI